MSELVGDALRRYRREQPRRDTAALAKAVEKLREEAARNGASKLTPAEIDAEIRAVRGARARKLPVAQAG